MGCVHGKSCCRSTNYCCCNFQPSSDDSETTDVADRNRKRNRKQHILTGNSVGSAYIPSHRLSLHYSSLTQRGHYPDSPNRLNQDSFLIRTQLQNNPNLHFFAVFDGHGQFGTECANFVRETLIENLSADPQLVENPTKSFGSAFLATNSLLHSSDIEDSMSGTTAIAVLVSGDTLYVANVGDSRAVAGVWNGDSIVAEDLSCDQTPFRKDEYERVRRCGARVLSVDQVEGIKDPEVQSWGDEENDEGDPPRLWVQNGLYPGTAFTRSVGDSTAESIGVVPVPEVLTVKIMPNHLFFVVASDGVFEFLSSQAVVDMVANFKDPRDACAAIAAESYRIWLEHENRTDDITIIIVHIKDMSNSGAAATGEVSRINTKASLAFSEKARVERYVFQGSGTCHPPRRGNFSELQSCPDSAMERSHACVAHSPEHPLSKCHPPRMGDFSELQSCPDSAMEQSHACVAASPGHPLSKCHPPRRGNFSELQSCPEFTMERSHACVVPSPEHPLSKCHPPRRGNFSELQSCPDSAMEWSHACVAASPEHPLSKCHPPRRGNFSELQSCPDFATEWSHACVVPSPEHHLSKCHPQRRGNFSELQSCPDYAMEWSHACVSPSPEHPLSLETGSIRNLTE